MSEPFRARLLLTLTLLFAARVLGQLGVLAFEPEFLPPFELWDSGLLPYPVLVCAQLLVLALQARIVRDVARGGSWAQPPGRGTVAIRGFAWVYIVVMLSRYPLTRFLAPGVHWAQGLIPIPFHLVLAAFLLVWSVASGSSSRVKPGGASDRTSPTP